MDYRGYVDAPENPAEEHSRFHSFSVRARLETVNRSSANQVMVVESGLPGTPGLFSDESPVLSHALTQMDQWLTNLGAVPAYGQARQRSRGRDPRSDGCMFHRWRYCQDC